MHDFTKKDIDRLWKKVDKSAPGGCWIWIGAWGGSGKPVFFYDKKLLHAGKVIIELVTQTPVAKTAKLFQVCKNERCVNPAHSFPDTLENRFWRLIDKNGPVMAHMETQCWSWLGFIAPDGYGKLSYRNKNLSAHRAAMIVTHGVIPDDRIVCHHCDNKTCANPDHLYFGDNAQNAIDTFNRGRMPLRGEGVGNSKITAGDVEEIRQLASDGVKQADIARRYKIDPGHISAIVNRKRWKHI